ncbi:MAG TPA: hypothetical protein VEV44_16400 [Pseudoneobacillus sp.]|nr:hypothetical protein [Pseudoneobacillus sp.]
MVAAILIPIIILYFYLVSKKDLKENEQKWKSLTQLHEEAIMTGEIVQLSVTKKRFYYHRYIQVVDIHLKTDTKTINVKRITPYTKNSRPVLLKKSDKVRLYGNWQENEFRFLRYEHIN